ncbi:MAG: recombinase family protein [Candidatus Acidiferrales bacterium]
MTKAFGYLRVSSDGQVDGDGFPRQRAAIEKWAAENGVVIVQWFTEEGISGAIENRPALERMRIALLSNGVKMVVIEKLDRIARDVAIQETIIKDLQKRGFTLVSALEPDLCSADPYRAAMRQMLGVFAELDRQTIVLKTRAARERIRATGARCEGRKPYGTRDGEQAVIARIREMHAAGSNYEQIAKQLNAEGIASRKGSWFGSTVRRIVRK